MTADMQTDRRTDKTWDAALAGRRSHNALRRQSESIGRRCRLTSFDGTRQMAVLMRRISARNISPLLLSTSNAASTTEHVLHQRIILLTYLLIGTEWKKTAAQRLGVSDCNAAQRQDIIYFRGLLSRAPESVVHFRKLSGLTMLN
jgi:hypothetical protein